MDVKNDPSHYGKHTVWAREQDAEKVIWTKGGINVIGGTEQIA